LKNECAPGRHKLDAVAGSGGGRGIGSVTGCHFGSLVGSDVGVIFGGEPTSPSRCQATQPCNGSDKAISSAGRRRISW
jgi:hypothetical protein